jgi:hypothetical protein
MARRLVTLLIVLLTCSGVIAETEEREGRALTSWYEACTRSQYSCEGVEMPKITYMDGGDLAEALGMPRESGNRVGGMYDGTGTIFVNDSETGFDLSETLFHEMIHYLQTKVGGRQIPGPPAEVCMDEAEAWSLAEQYARDNGLNVDYSNWWFSYFHCWPYFAEEVSVP